MGRSITLNVPNLTVEQKTYKAAGQTVTVSDETYQGLVDADRVADGTITDNGYVEVGGEPIDIEQARDMLNTVLVPGKGVSLTPDDEANTLLLSITESGLFKGNWTVTPEELIYSESFDADMGVWAGTATRLAMSSAVGINKPADYNWVAQASNAPGTANVTTHQLDLTTLQEAIGRTLSKLRLHYVQTTTTAGSSRAITYEILVNGSIEHSVVHNVSSGVGRTDEPWAVLEVPDPAGTVVMRHRSSGSTFAPTARRAVTGVEIYAAEEDWAGYAVGDFVVHGGRLWRSDIANNSSEPGVADWTAVSLVEPETAWGCPTFLGTWVDFGGTYAPAGYRKDAWGRVFLRGLIKTGTIGQAAFTLPVGFRPAFQSGFATFNSNGTAGQVDIGTNGNVVPTSGTNGFVSLEGINFSTT